MDGVERNSTLDGVLLPTLGGLAPPESAGPVPPLFAQTLQTALQQNLPVDAATAEILPPVVNLPAVPVADPLTGLDDVLEFLAAALATFDRQQPAATESTAKETTAACSPTHHCAVPETVPPLPFAPVALTADEPAEMSLLTGEPASAVERTERAEAPVKPEALSPISLALLAGFGATPPVNPTLVRVEHAPPEPAEPLPAGPVEFMTALGHGTPSPTQHSRHQPEHRAAPPSGIAASVALGRVAARVEPQVAPPRVETEETLPLTREPATARHTPRAVVDPPVTLPSVSAAPWTAPVASPASPSSFPPRATAEAAPRVVPAASPAVPATPPLRTPSLSTLADADHAVLSVSTVTAAPATDIPTPDDTAIPPVATKPAPMTVVPTSTRHTAAPAAVPATPDVPPVRSTSTPPRAVVPTTELEPTSKVVAESESGVQPTEVTAPAPLRDTTVDTPALKSSQTAITPERGEPISMPAEPVMPHEERTPAVSATAPSLADIPSAPAPDHRTVLPTHNAERLIERLTEMVSTAHDSGRELSVRLAPPELGPLLIEVRSDSGVMTARLETQTDAARQTLLEHLPQLQEALAQRGTPIDRVDIIRTEPRDAATGSFADPQWSTPQQQSQPDQRDPPRRRPPVLNRPTIDTPIIAAPPRGDIHLREINVTI